MSCNIWLWSDVHKQKAEKNGTNLPQEFAIHTHRNVKDDATGKFVFKPNGDPYAGIYCDCCNMKTRSRSYSTKFNSVTPELEAQEEKIIQLTFADAELSLPSAEAMDIAVKEIQNHILIDKDTILKIVASLVSGKNILLTGAVGTGKTHLAKILPEIVWRENEIGGYHAGVHTATSDWTTKDVIGGIVPKLEEDEDGDEDVTYSIEKGCVTETVSKNWRDESSEEKIRIFSNAESNIDGEERRFRG
jgi:ATPase subunit of ABC transporter with duplicated ATPase domains